jgi:hypothetical protein
MGLRQKPNMGSKTHLQSPTQNIKTLNFYIDNAAVVKTAYNITPASRQWIGKQIKETLTDG